MLALDNIFFYFSFIQLILYVFFIIFLLILINRFNKHNYTNVLFCLINFFNLNLSFNFSSFFLINIDDLFFHLLI